MKQNLTESRMNYHFDIKNASKGKKLKWEELKTEELEKLFSEITLSLKSSPNSTWNAWDDESLKMVQKVLTDRRADDVRRDIARILELSGLHYGIEKQMFRTKQARQNKK
jgi:hypothetical protein